MNRKLRLLISSLGLLFALGVLLPSLTLAQDGEPESKPASEPASKKDKGEEPGGEPSSEPASEPGSQPK